jgi:hypothetical protein
MEHAMHVMTMVKVNDRVPDSPARLLQTQHIIPHHDKMLLQRHLHQISKGSCGSRVHRATLPHPTPNGCPPRHTLRSAATNTRVREIWQHPKQMVLSSMTGPQWPDPNSDTSDKPAGTCTTK